MTSIPKLTLEDVSIIWRDAGLSDEDVSQVLLEPGTAEITFLLRNEDGSVVLDRGEVLEATVIRKTE